MRASIRYTPCLAILVSLVLTQEAPMSNPTHPTQSANESGDASPEAISRAERPSSRRHVFASLFTPTWSLGLLLFCCLFLPAFEGCAGETVYIVHEIFDGDVVAWPHFFIVWPYLFGLIVCLGIAGNRITAISPNRSPDSELVQTDRG